MLEAQFTESNCVGTEQTFWNVVVGDCVLLNRPTSLTHTHTRSPLCHSFICSCCQQLLKQSIRAVGWTRTQCCSLHIMTVLSHSVNYSYCDNGDILFILGFYGLICVHCTQICPYWERCASGCVCFTAACESNPLWDNSSALFTEELLVLCWSSLVPV